MKKIFIVLVLLLNLFPASRIFAEDADDAAGDFLLKGTVTDLNAAGKIFKVKAEGGFELTFHAEDSAQGTPESAAGKPPASSLLHGLAPSDSVEVAYRYNKDYEKIATSVKKIPAAETAKKPASP